MAPGRFFFFTALLLNSFNALSQRNLGPLPDSLKPIPVIRPLPQNFYSKGLGYFCKKEVQVQKLTGLPIFFRLGSKAYVDYLERKPGTFVGRTGLSDR